MPTINITFNCIIMVTRDIKKADQLPRKNLGTESWRDEGQKQQQHAMSTDLSPKAVFVSLLIIGIGLSGVHWITIANQGNFLEQSTMECVLLIYMVSAVILMAIFKSSCASRAKVPDLYWQSESKVTLGTLYLANVRNTVPILGMIVFYLLALSNDLLRILTNIGCLQELSNGDVIAPPFVHTLYHVGRRLFMASLLAFCISFHNKVIRWRWLSRYSLVLILTTIGSVLLHCILYESTRMSLAPNWYRNKSSSPQLSSVKAVMSQYLQEEDVDNVLTPSIYALNIQFFLLGLERIVHLWHTMEHFHPELPCDEDSSRTRTETIMDSYRMHVGVTWIPQLTRIDGETRKNVRAIPNCEKITVNTKSYLIYPRNEHHCHSFYDTKTWQVSGVSHRKRRIYGSTITSANESATQSYSSPGGVFLVILCTVWNMFVIALSFLTLFDVEWNIINVFLICMAANWFSMCVICLAGLYTIMSMTPQFPQYNNALPIFMALASFGAFLWGFVSMITAMATWMVTGRIFDTEKDASQMDIVTVIDRLLHLFQIYLQTCFMLLARGFKVNRDKGRRESNRGFRTILLQLFIFNMTTWIIDSFVVQCGDRLDHATTPYQRNHAWDIIVRAAMPLHLFYRFSSAAFFLQEFCDVMTSV